MCNNHLPSNLNEAILQKHPEFHTGRWISEDEEWVVVLLLRYVHLAMENAPEEKWFSEISRLLILMVIAEVLPLQLQPMVGSTLTIAISRCLWVCMLSSTYQQIGLIFSFVEVYCSFTSVERNGLFLDVLEPYVLNDRLIYATPEVMANFVEHCHGIDDFFCCRTLPLSLGCNHNGLWFNSYIAKKKWNVHSSPSFIRKWVEWFVFYYLMLHSIYQESKCCWY